MAGVHRRVERQWAEWQRDLESDWWGEHVMEWLEEHPSVLVLLAMLVAAGVLTIVVAAAVTHA
jgi:hypothetical protein